MTKLIKKSLPLFLLIIFSLPSHASDWRLDKEENGIKVYTRDVANSAIREFKGEVVINSSMDSILAVFDDTPQFPKWNHQCSKATQLESSDPNKRYHYQNINMPFPVTDRDLIIKSTISRVGDKSVINSAVDASFCKNSALEKCKAINQSKNIMVIKSKGEHQIVPQKEGGVKVTWVQHTEPAGKIPNWLVNNLLIDVPYNTLNGLREQVKLEKYQKAKIQCHGNNCGLAK